MTRKDSAPNPIHSNRSRRMTSAVLSIVAPLSFTAACDFPSLDPEFDFKQPLGDIAAGTRILPDDAKIWNGTNIRFDDKVLETAGAICDTAEYPIAVGGMRVAISTGDGYGSRYGFTVDELANSGVFLTAEARSDFMDGCASDNDQKVWALASQVSKTEPTASLEPTRLG